MFISDKPSQRYRFCNVLERFVTGWFCLMIAMCTYYIGTFQQRTDCHLCFRQQTPFPPFLYFTMWTLWWTAFVQIGGQFSGGMHRWPLWRSIAFQIALPLSTTVSIAYLVYFFNNDAGEELVNSDLCYALLDVGVPKTFGRTYANFFIAITTSGSVTSHFFCAPWNIYTYARYFRPASKPSKADSPDEVPTDDQIETITVEDFELESSEIIPEDIPVEETISDASDIESPGTEKAADVALLTKVRFWPTFTYVILHALVLGLVQEFVDPVYCSDNIWIICGQTVVMVSFFHVVWFNAKFHKAVKRVLSCVIKNR